ncbi:hypothetical protein ACI1T6_04995 [Lactococcus petauri]|uniref:lectin-like domain-containing protein n=1 Tax=Lactococcus petauri TaxID=1940789 RepID=UPI003853DFDF
MGKIAKKLLKHLILRALFPLLLLFPLTLVKAETNNIIVNPGDKIDTGNHDFSPTELKETTNWGILGTSSPWWDANGYTLMLNNQGKDKVGYGVFKYALDFSKPVKLTASFGVNINNAYTYAAGDSLGFILTDVNANEITKGQSGGGLGILGIPNAIFAGRDFYYNFGIPTYDSSVGQVTEGPLLGRVNGSSQITIRQTSADGLSLLKPDTLSAVSAQYGIFNKGSGSTKSTGIDYVQLEWIPTDGGMVTSSGKVSGYLKLTYGSGVDANGDVNGSTTSVLYGNPTDSSLQLSQMLSIGVAGATGGNYSDLSFNAQSSYLTGSKATQDVKVNYINAVTGKKILTKEQAVIHANVGDTVSLHSPSASPDSNRDFYEYLAPDLTSEGFTFKGISTGNSIDTSNNNSTSDLTVLNNDEIITTPEGLETPTNNTFNIYYTPTLQSAKFISWYSQGTPGTSEALTDISGTVFAQPSNTPTTPGKAAALPKALSIEGYLEDAVPEPALEIPKGYKIAKVIGPDKKVYSSIELARLANLLLYMNDNEFNVVLEANTHRASFSYQYGKGTPGVDDNTGLPSTTPTTPGPMAPELPQISAAEDQQGTTGSPIASPIINPIDIPGYSVTSILKPGNTLVPVATGIHPESDWMSWDYSQETITGEDSQFVYIITPDVQTSIVGFVYSPGTPGVDEGGIPSDNPVIPGKAAPLPAAQKISGVTNGLLTIEKPNIPAGYTIDYVIGPDGTSYSVEGTLLTMINMKGQVTTETVAAGTTALEAANNHHPYFIIAPNIIANNFAVYLKALPRTSMIYFDVSKVDAPDEVPQPKNITLSQGVTGSIISKNDIDTAVSALQAMITDENGYEKWEISQVLGPNKDELDLNVIEGNNNAIIGQLPTLINKTPYLLGESSDYKNDDGDKVVNNYIFKLSYSGKLLLTVPDTLSFGDHFVNGGNPVYTGQLSDDVIVTDERAILTPWTLTVEELSPIQEINPITLLPLVKGVGVTFTDCLSFGENEETAKTLTSSNSIEIFKQDFGTSNPITVLPRSHPSIQFYLKVPDEKQKVGKNYSGKLEWTIELVK